MKLFVKNNGVLVIEVERRLEGAGIREDCKANDQTDGKQVLFRPQRLLFFRRGFRGL